MTSAITLGSRIFDSGQYSALVRETTMVAWMMKRMIGSAEFHLLGLSPSKIPACEVTVPLVALAASQEAAPSTASTQAMVGGSRATRGSFGVFGAPVGKLLDSAQANSPSQGQLNQARLQEYPKGDGVEREDRSIYYLNPLLQTPAYTIKTEERDPRHPKDQSLQATAGQEKLESVESMPSGGLTNGKAGNFAIQPRRPKSHD